MTSILFLKSHLSAKGGLEKYTLRLASAFANQGYKTTILTTGQIPVLNAPIEVISFDIPKITSLYHMWKFDKKCQTWIKENPQTHVFGLERNRFQTHYRAGNGVHAAYLHQRSRFESFFKSLTFYLNPLHRTILNYERTAFECPHLRKLFTNSHLVKEQILHHYNTPAAKIEVVHNGVEWHEMQIPFDEWPKKQLDLRLHFGLDPSAYQLLFIGHGYRRKGLEYLLKALSQFQNKKIELSILGKDKEHSYFQALAKRLGIQKQTHFFGPQIDIIPFYQMADALCIPSLYDPFANVTIEALAMGLFVISSPWNGGCEILNPFSGRTFKTLAVSEISLSLEEALSLPKTMTRAQRIRDSVKHLDFSHQLEKLISSTLAS